MNSGGVLNLTSINYTGLNPELQNLDSNGDGTVTATFQFIPAQTLTALKASTGITNTYSGSVSSGHSVPEPTSLLLIAAGLISIVAMRRKAL
jgi:hypothetical protein